MFPSGFHGNPHSLTREQRLKLNRHQVACIVTSEMLREGAQLYMISYCHDVLEIPMYYGPLKSERSYGGVWASALFCAFLSVEV